MDEWKTEDVIYLHFSKAPDTVSHGILLENLPASGLDRCNLCWALPLAGGLGQESSGEWSFIQLADGH